MSTALRLLNSRCVQTSITERGHSCGDMADIRLFAELRPRPSVVLEHLRDRVLETAARHRIRAVDVFGSLAIGHDTSDSDVDLLVHLEPGASLFDLCALRGGGRGHSRVSRDAVCAHAIAAAMPRIRAEAVPL